LTDVEAFDTNGNPLSVDGQAEFEVPVNPDMTAVQLRLPIELPKREVKKLSRLEGTLKALLPGPIETFRFNDLLATDVEQRSAGVTVLFEQARMAGPVCKVFIRLRFDQAKDALESHRGWIFENEAFLVKKVNSKQTKHDGLEVISRSKNEIGIAYIFNLDEPPNDYAFVYRTPSAITPTSFKYKLDDIRLP